MYDEKTMKATIVVLYRNKTDDLRVLLADCQNAVAEILGSRFRKYDIGQIHGTIVGLEHGKTDTNRWFNRNFKTHRDNEVAMDFEGLLAFLRNGGHFPFQLQIGGFQDRDYPFTSRGIRPFNRCFSLQGKNVVLMGWPLRGLPLKNAPSSPYEMIQEARLYPMTLDYVRRGAQRYGVLHSYHAKPEDTDNDFFFRIGMVDDPSSIDSGLKARLQETMRNFLAALPSLILNVELSDLYVAFYESEELTLNTTNEYSLSNEELNGDFISLRLQSSRNI